MQKTAPESSAHPAPCLVHLKVMLIAEDEPLRERLARLLRAADHAVIDCASTAHALGHLREGVAPDLVLLDMALPESGRVQFRQQQLRDARWSSVPVIALGDAPSLARPGAHFDAPPAAPALGSGSADADAELTKPIDERTLLDTLQRLASGVQRRSLARVSEFQRLISLGSLIGGIAHEINDPLAFVEGNLDLLQQQLVALAGPQGGSVPFAVANALRALERVKVGTERIASVVQCVSLFAAADPACIEQLDIHQVLESSMQVAAGEIRHSAALERSYESAPHVRGNPAKLGQVFLNLLLNAVSAIRESEERDHVIRVSTRVDARPEASEQNVEPAWVVITVSDTASPRSAAFADSLFDPLASVASGRMGLLFGLAISREVVESMGGSIEVTHPGARGATFSVRLPSCTPVSYPAPLPRVSPVVPRAHKRASLVAVDDDPLMCEVLATILCDEYDVATFTSPRAALASMLQGKFDLILCDVMMPDLNGIELYDRLVSERPELANRFIFITGGAFTERARVFLRRADRPIVKKPFAMRQLIKTIQNTLVAAELHGTPVIES